MNPERYCSLRSLDFLTRIAVYRENIETIEQVFDDSYPYEKIRDELMKEDDPCFTSSKNYYSEVKDENLNPFTGKISLETRLRANLTPSDLRRHNNFLDHNQSYTELFRKWLAERIK